MNELDIIKMRVNAEKSNVKNTLINRIESLIATLENEAKRLKEDENYSPSKAGIIQSESATIDTLSARLATLNDLIK